MTTNLLHNLSVTPNLARFDASDLPYALHDLHRLTQTLVDTINEMDFGTGDDRNTALDRVSSLAKIVSDQVALLAITADVFDGPAKWERVR
ncbi:hypothetical protein [Shinella sp.]|uniref:hypothetical protein n=1 Tax=Shinella sp. TaxID=1870904 RepID=UPI003F6F5092